MCLVISNRQTVPGSFNTVKRCRFPHSFRRFPVLVFFACSSLSAGELLSVPRLLGDFPVEALAVEVTVLSPDGRTLAAGLRDSVVLLEVASRYIGKD